MSTISDQVARYVESLGAKENSYFEETGSQVKELIQNKINYVVRRIYSTISAEWQRDRGAFIRGYTVFPLCIQGTEKELNLLRTLLTQQYDIFSKAVDKKEHQHSEHGIIDVIKELSVVDDPKLEQTLAPAANTYGSNSSANINPGNKVKCWAINFSWSTSPKNPELSYLQLQNCTQNQAGGGRNQQLEGMPQLNLDKS